MATVRFVVNLALRKIGVLGKGREPHLSDAADALSALQTLYTSWIVGGAFGRLREVVPTGTNYVAYGNERIYRQDSTLIVTLPELVSSETCLDYGHERIGYYGTIITVTDQPNGDTVVDVQTSQPIGYVEPPRDGSVVIISDKEGGETRTWLYDGTIKSWQGIETLTLDDDAPRSTADTQGLAACLAMEISDQFGVDIPQATARQAARYTVAMTHRYGFERKVVPGVYC